jgi:hypothetical protein
MSESWFRPEAVEGSRAVLAIAALGLIAFMRLAWLYHARSARRWQSVWDAHAVREIARGRGASRPLE